jgi:hypothetical protein
MLTPGISVIRFSSLPTKEAILRASSERNPLVGVGFRAAFSLVFFMSATFRAAFARLFRTESLARCAKRVRRNDTAGGAPRCSQLHRRLPSFAASMAPDWELDRYCAGESLDQTSAID